MECCPTHELDEASQEYKSSRQGHAMKHTLWFSRTTRPGAMAAFSREFGKLTLEQET